MYEIVIKECRVLDGSGNPWFWSDVAVDQGRIVCMGKLNGAAARRVIAAGGRFLAPGFIDMHTHSDLHLLANPMQACKVRQGVTTEVIGHDGLGLAPVTPQTLMRVVTPLAVSGVRANTQVRYCDSRR